MADQPRRGRDPRQVRLPVHLRVPHQFCGQIPLTLHLHDVRVEVRGGLTLPALTTLGMSGATDADAGVLSGVFNTVQQVGGALGLATLTALAAPAPGPAPRRRP